MNKCRFKQTTFEQTFFEKTAFEQTSFERTSLEQTSFEQTSFEQTSLKNVMSPDCPSKDYANAGVNGITCSEQKFGLDLLNILNTFKYWGKYLILKLSQYRKWHKN